MVNISDMSDAYALSYVFGMIFPTRQNNVRNEFFLLTHLLAELWPNLLKQRFGNIELASVFRTMVEFKLYIATSEIRTQNFQYSETFTFLNIALDLGFSSQERIISIENKLVHWTPNNYPSEGKVTCLFIFSSFVFCHIRRYSNFE